MSELQKWYWNAAGMQDSGQPDDRPFFEAAEVEAVLDTSMQRQETLAKHVNEGLLEIRGLRAGLAEAHEGIKAYAAACATCQAENERLTRILRLTGEGGEAKFQDLTAQLAAMTQERDDLRQKCDDLARLVYYGGIKKSDEKETV